MTTFKRTLILLGWLCSPLTLADTWWQGELTSGGFIWVETPAGSGLTVDGEALSTFPPRTLVGLPRNPADQIQLERTLADGQMQQATLEIGPRTFFEQFVQGVPSATVTPNPEQQARIQTELAQTLAARSQPRADALGVQMPFAWPVFGRITSVYGSQRWFNQIAHAPHWGIDIAAPVGTPVLAPAAGTITLAANLLLSGGTVMMDHGQQLTSAFLHLSDWSVAVGDAVQQGDVIGFVGATGRATGPHLDWRLDWAGTRIDAQLWVPPMAEVCAIEGSGNSLVVLLHGLGRTPLSMVDMARSLRSAGFSTCNQGYPSRDYTIEALAPYVASAVQRGRAAGFEQIHFVTHSLGGILVRYYLTLSAHNMPGSVVMLAPPNHGSKVVDALESVPGFSELMGPAALQLTTDLNSLPNQLPDVGLPTGIIAGDRSSDPWFGVLFNTASDGKVSVPSTQLMSMRDHIVLPVGHTLMMHDDEVQKAVLNFLQYQSFTPPAE